MIYFKVKGILTKAVTFDEFTRLNITLSKVKTKPMLWFCPRYFGGLQGGLQGHYHVLWLKLLYACWLLSLSLLP